MFGKQGSMFGPLIIASTPGNVLAGKRMVGLTNPLGSVASFRPKCCLACDGELHNVFLKCILTSIMDVMEGDNGQRSTALLE